LLTLARSGPQGGAVSYMPIPRTAHVLEQFGSHLSVSGNPNCSIGVTNIGLLKYVHDCDGCSIGRMFCVTHEPACACKINRV